MSNAQKCEPTKGPMRDQVMPVYTYQPAQANTTVTVKRDAKQKVSVLVNGVFTY